MQAPKSKKNLVGRNAQRTTIGGMNNKVPSSYRLSPECRRLMGRLSGALGISKTSVIEQAVRKLARLELDGERVGDVPPDGRRRPAGRSRGRKEK
jgi:hypothetical protein